ILYKCVEAAQLRDKIKYLRIIIGYSGSNVLYCAPHFRNIDASCLPLEGFCGVDIDFPPLEGRVRSCDGEDEALDFEIASLEPGNSTKIEGNKHLCRF